MTTIQCKEAKGEVMGPDKGKFFFFLIEFNKMLSGPIGQIRISETLYALPVGRAHIFISKGSSQNKYKPLMAGKC